MNSYSNGFDANTPTPRGYEKALEKGRDGEGVVTTENEQLFRWLEGFNIPVILGSRSWDQSTAMMVEGWRLVFTPFDDIKYRHSISKAVEGIASTELIDGIEETTLKAFKDGGGSRDIFEDHLYRARWYDYREELERKKKHGLSWSGIMSATYPELKWIVPGVLPEGLSVLSGAPKIGKSWFALDLALSVATGRPFLGDIIPAQGDVLYWALEDSARRLKGRMGDIAGDYAPNDGLIIRTAKAMPKQLDKGGLDDLKHWFEDVDNPTLAIIDVLEKVRPESKSGENAYAALYRGLNDLFIFAQLSGLSVLVMHHNRKGARSADPFEDVAGSMAFTSLPDAALVMRKEFQGSADAILYGRGRDLDEFDHGLAFEGKRWEIIGDLASARRSAQRQKIIDCIGGETKTPKEISEATGEKVNNVNRLLRKMVEAGELENRNYGQYSIPIPG